MAKNTGQNKTKKKVSKRAAPAKAGPGKSTKVKNSVADKAARGTKKPDSKKMTSTGTTKKRVPAVAAAPVKKTPPPPPPEPVDTTPELPSMTQLRKAKSGLTRSDLNQYREQLVQRRAEILGDVVALESDARTHSGDHLSPEHMADVGSNNYEQEFRLGLVESERKILVEIDDALMRIQNRVYGVCLEQAVPIGKARLDAKPWAKYCIEVVREKERRGEI